MSTARRQLVIHEQSDGSFRIPPELTISMGTRVDSVEPILNEEAPLSQQTRTAAMRIQDEALAQLRDEVQFYKNKYIACFKQLEDIQDLCRCISRKLELALRTTTLDIQIEPTTLYSDRLVHGDTITVLGREQLHTGLGESTSTSRRYTEIPATGSCALFPPKKRHRQG